MSIEGLSLAASPFRTTSAQVVLGAVYRGCPNLICAVALVALGHLMVVDRRMMPYPGWAHVRAWERYVASWLLMRECPLCAVSLARPTRLLRAGYYFGVSRNNEDRRFDAIAHPARRAVLMYLGDHNSARAGDMSRDLEIVPSTLSGHLRMCRCGRAGRIHWQRTRRGLPHPSRRRIGSAALVADGLHARTDGFTSLAVLIGAGGIAFGVPLADPSSACSSPWQSCSSCAPPPVASSAG